MQIKQGQKSKVSVDQWVVLCKTDKKKDKTSYKSCTKRTEILFEKMWALLVLIGAASVSAHLQDLSFDG